MVALFFVLVGISFTASVFLIARFGFFRKENPDVVEIHDDKA